MSVPAVFISYSHRDEEWKNRLQPHLEMLEVQNQIKLWHDRMIDVGADWFPEITKAMKNAAVAICLISPHYLASKFVNQEEIPYLLQRRESDGMLLLPVLVEPCLWNVVEWLRSIQMLPRDGKSIADDFQGRENAAFTEVARKVYSKISDPSFKISAPMPDLLPPEKIDIGRLPVTGAELFGRQKELAMLNKAWESDSTNVVSLVAWGGMGKSTLVNKWLERMDADNYRGAQRVYGWSFDSQGTVDRVTSADQFIAEALAWFGDPDMAKIDCSSSAKGERLAELIRREKTLLILDGMEPLQSSLGSEHGKVKDKALAVLLFELAHENPGMCLISTREKVADLDDFPKASLQMDLEQISDTSGRALLRVGGVRGTDAELVEVSSAFGNQALALNLLAAYLHCIPEHKISHAFEIPDIDVPEKEGRHPRRVMAAFGKRFGESAEVELLRVLGLFDRPADADAIAAVRTEPAIPGLTEHIQRLSERNWLLLLGKLRKCKLIAPERHYESDVPDDLDAHPLVREHFGEKLRNENRVSWREAHIRLSEYYKSTREPESDWKSIGNLSPQLQEFKHRILAEDCDNACRLLDSIDSYWNSYLYKWGHYKLSSELREEVQEKLSNTILKAGNLVNLGKAYIRLGNIEEKKVEELMNEAFSIYQRNGDRKGQANSIFGIADIYQLRAEFDKAIKEFEKASSIYKGISYVFGEAESIFGIANTYRKQYLLDQAIKRFQKAQCLYEKLDDRYKRTNVMAKSIQRLAAIYCMKKCYDKADKMNAEALRLYRDINDIRGIAIATEWSGNICLGKCEGEQAKKEYDSASKLYERIRDKLGIANCHRGYGDIAANDLDYQKAMGHYQKAIKSFEEMRANADIAIASIGISRFLLESDHQKKAAKFYGFTREFYSSQGSYENVKQVEPLEILEKKLRIKLGEKQFTELTRTSESWIESRYLSSLLGQLLDNYSKHKENDN